MLKSLVNEKLTALEIGNKVNKNEHFVRRKLKKYNLKTFRYIDKNLKDEERKKEKITERGPKVRPPVLGTGHRVSSILTAPITIIKK